MLRGERTVTEHRCWDTGKSHQKDLLLFMSVNPSGSGTQTGSSEALRRREKTTRDFGDDFLDVPPSHKVYFRGT